MNHKAKVNTTSAIDQVNSVNTMLPFTAIKQHANDIEDQALCIRSLSELVFEQIDAIAEAVLDSKLITISLRLDALMKAIDRNAALIQDGVGHIGFALLEAQGGAQ